MTKSQQAQAIYQERVNNNLDVSRSTLIQLFMSQISMSQACASTYAHNVKHGAKSYYKPKQKSTDVVFVNDVSVEDNRTVYTIAFFKHNTLVMSHSGYNKDSVVNYQLKKKSVDFSDKVCFIGTLESDSTTLSQVRESYQIIN